MDELTFSIATDRDCEWAAHLMSTSEPWMQLGSTYESCLSVCRNPEYDVIIPRVNNHAGGVLILDPSGLAGSPYIKSIAVDTQARGSGIGARMMEYAEHYYPESSHLFLCVSSFNLRAIAFYERLGYRQVGTLKDYLIRGADELIYSKRLR